ncbi:MAG TPA: rhodanese-like domain-containing protein [Ilumatobacteraceae bacterium]|nr:rhodanese-like domain-containing protein [Ilumatobacteraceae bacterium]HRB03951.1 rhodanese-like domain-containing protein [Ilumatobacteraceae bacterium]
MTDTPTPNTIADASHGQTAGRSATPLIVAMVILVVAVVVYFATGMPGMDHSSTTETHDMSDMSANTAHRMMDPAEFAAVIVDPDTVTINVHVPAADIQLDGTEMTMPFDNLDEGQLPSDRDTPLAVYCRSGTMSAIAVERLLALGYTDIIELDGGTDAWAAAGQ